MPLLRFRNAPWIVLGSVLGAISTPVLADSIQNPPIATVKSLKSGDRACYVEVVDDRAKRSIQFAEFSICEEQQNLVGKRVQLTYKDGKIMAASCQGNIECGKTDSVMLINKISWLRSDTRQSSAMIQPKMLTFTRGTRGQEESGYKQAMVAYPVITNGPNPAVLKQVQNSIALKQVLGESIEEIEADFKRGGWLSQLSYTVDYNKNSIVQFTYTRMGSSAYPSTFRNYVAVDLQTGQIITAADLFSQGGLPKVVDLLNQVMQKRVQKTIAEKKSEYPDMTSRLAGKKFNPKELNDFIIGENGITFVYDFGFPHVAKVLEPNSQFFLSYAQLRPYFKAVGLRALI